MISEYSFVSCFSWVAFWGPIKVKFDHICGRGIPLCGRLSDDGGFIVIMLSLQDLYFPVVPNILFLCLSGEVLCFPFLECQGFLECSSIDFSRWFPVEYFGFWKLFYFFPSKLSREVSPGGLSRESLEACCCREQGPSCEWCLWYPSTVCKVFP